MSPDPTIPALGTELAKVRADVAKAVKLPKYAGTVVTNFARDPRAAGDNGYWVQSTGTSRAYESASTLPWGHGTKTNAAFTVTSAGTASFYYIV